MVSQILDRYGRPFERETLEEPQTAPLVWLHREFAAHPSRGLTPTKASRILEDAERENIIAQYELFEDMEERDAHIACEMGKRRRAILGLEWSIEPPRNADAREKKSTEAVRELINEVPGFEDVIFDMTDAIGKGFACLEIAWNGDPRERLPASIAHRPQTWFRLYRGPTQEIRLRDLSADGAPLNPFGWITHVHRAKSGYIERAALFRSLVWPFLFKNFAIGDLAEFLEIYGIPIRIGKYPSGASEPDKAVIRRALQGVGHNASGIIPDTMQIEFQKAADGDPDAFVAMVDWCERSQSKAILGATLTSQADRGSNTNALGNVHNEVRKDLRDSDAKQIEATLTRDLVYPIAALNGLAPDGLRRSPRFIINVREPEDLKLYAAALPSLVNVGMEIPTRWAAEQLRIPQPQDGEAVLKATAQPVPTLPGTDLKPTAALTARIEATSVPLDPPAQMVERMGAALDPAMEDWLGRIRALIAKASSLEEVRDGLIELLPNLSLDQYAGAMREALAAAALAGRYEILREAGGA
jgi:phage gp29-like protein